MNANAKGGETPMVGGLVLLLLLAGCAGGNVGADDWLVPDACHAAVERTLTQKRIVPDTVSQASWTIERFNNAPADPEDWPVSGYTFTGRPERCASGDVVVQLTAQCLVNQVYGRFGCAVAP